MFLIISLIVSFGKVLRADTRDSTRIEAVRTDSRIILDGILSEHVWQRPGFTGFTERDPNEGTRPTQRTEVWIAYDDEAIYVAARMYDTAPDSIIARLARRDTKVSSDYFVFYVDSYHDRRSGFYFSINAAGTIGDGTLYNDDWSDNTWDGVWEGKARIDSLGWTAELRIPFSQLRFDRGTAYVWGVDFERFIGRSNEDDFVAYTPKNSSGFVSRFVDMVGIDGIDAHRPVELLPYLTTKAEYLNVGSGDPFNSGSKYMPGVGGDLKVGIGNNLTLDGTVNPDFGQVEVDPAVVNLSDIETYYDEKRPFFIEGADIFSNFGQGGSNDFWNFNFEDPQFFYTRRIGRAPEGSIPSANYVDEPTGTPIIGATKLTGRISGGWTAGMIHALTSPVSAQVDTSGSIFAVPVEPLTYYGVARIRKEINGGTQSIGFISTLSERRFGVGTLRDQLNSSSMSLAVDGWSFLDHDKEWVLTGWAGVSRVAGDRTRMISLQEDEPHYLQRPDAGYLHLDSNATSMSGYAARFWLNKQKGNLYVNAAFGLIDPRFDVNDLGFMWRADILNSHLVVGYQWTKPGAVARSAAIYFALFRGYDFGGKLTANGYFSHGNMEFLNYYSVYANFGYDPVSLNDYATRGGPRLLNLPGWWIDTGLNSDSRKEWTFNTEVQASSAQTGDHDVTYSVNVQWMPKQNVSFSFGPSYEQSNRDAQWVGNFVDAYAVRTYGERYVFATLSQKTLSANIRVDWTFTPQLSFQIYAQPLISAGNYHGYKELAKPAAYDFNFYGKNGGTISQDDGTYRVDPDGPGPAPPFTFSDPNFSYKSLRGDAILRWEYTPGSTLYLVWTQNRTDSQYPGFMEINRDLRDLMSARPDNIFLVKLTYWLDI